MRAVLVQDRAPQRPRPLVVTEVDDPLAGPGEVVMRIAATAVNRADLLQRRGLYPPPPGESPIMGLEASGWIECIGSDVEGWSVGDRAMALLAGGGYAERVAVPVGQLMPVPRGWDLLHAAAVPEAFLTAWMALREFTDTRSGHSVLIHAGASGVGTAAIQMATQLGATVLATTRTAAKRAEIARLGAIPICSAHDGWTETIADHTGGRGVDVAIELVGAATLPDTIRCMAVGGRIAVIGLMGGTDVRIDLGLLLSRRVGIRSGGLRARSRAEKAALIADFTAWALPRFADGRLRPVLDRRRLRLEDVEAAHAALEANDTVGKVVLAVNGR